MFEPDREPDQRVGDAGEEPRLARRRGVGHQRRNADKAFKSAKRFCDGEEFEASHEIVRIDAGRKFDRQHGAETALLSLGDRRVAPAIEAAERNGQNWRAAVEESGVDADFFIFRDRSADAFLPWDIIDGGLKANFYRSEFDKAMRAEWTLPPKRAQENARLLLPLIER